MNRRARAKPDDLDGVASVIDGITGREISVEDYLAMKSKDAGRHSASRFIKGPLPVATLATATQKSPAALQAALVLFFLHGLTGKRRFKAEPARFDELGISRKSRQRGLQALQEIGLITLERRNGCSLEVVLLDGFFGPKVSG